MRTSIIGFSIIIFMCIWCGRRNQVKFPVHQVPNPPPIPGISNCSAKSVKLSNSYVVSFNSNFVLTWHHYKHCQSLKSITFQQRHHARDPRATVTVSIVSISQFTYFFNSVAKVIMSGKMGRGKGGKGMGLGKGGSKRLAKVRACSHTSFVHWSIPVHFMLFGMATTSKVSQDNVKGVTKPAIRRMARRTFILSINEFFFFSDTAPCTGA